VGQKEPITVQFYRGDTGKLVPQVLNGHWPDGPGQVAAPGRFLNQRGLKLGDTITLEENGKRAPVEIVGDVLTNDASQIFANWQTLPLLAPGARAESYQVQLKPGTDAQAFLTAVTTGDPGLQGVPASDNLGSQAVVIISAATLLTMLLGFVAGLGVFNTVVLNTRERRRDLGMLKSIGMTPRQVTLMMVTSMGALGLVGGLLGLPLGFAVHRLIVPAIFAAAQADVADVVVNVYRAPILVLLALAGVVIAVLGAVVPARRAARLTIAEVLHNE
jgi:putative ABC transport system permease protein